MADLPRECRAEPKLAFDGGADGLDIVRRILDQAAAHLAPQGGLLCEIGRCRPQLEARLSATAAALARHRGFRGRSILDRRRRSLDRAIARKYRGAAAFRFQEQIGEVIEKAVKVIRAAAWPRQEHSRTTRRSFYRRRRFCLRRWRIAKDARARE